MPVMVKAVYQGGILQLLEPVDELVDSQEVQIQVWPARSAPAFEVPPGIWPEHLTTEQIQGRREAVRSTRGLVVLDDPDIAWA